MHLCQYLPEFFLQWEMFQKIFVQNMTAHILWGDQTHESVFHGQKALQVLDRVSTAITCTPFCITMQVLYYRLPLSWDSCNILCYIHQQLQYFSERIYAHLNSREKHLLAASRPSVCRSVRPSLYINTAQTGWISVKFDTGCGSGECSWKTCRENPNMFKIGENYQALYVKTELNFIFAGDIKSP